MGYIVEPSEEMGEYSVETRGGTFYLSGASLFQHAYEGADVPEHVIHVYPTTGPTVKASAGTIEVLTADIPKIRAALDQVEAVARLGGSSYHQQRPDREAIEARWREQEQREEEAAALRQQAAELEQRARQLVSE